MSKEPVHNFENEIEELLDRTVEHYRSAEPRPGLERRLLAHVRSAPAPSFRWNWQIAAVAGAAALSVAALYFALWPAPSIPSPGRTTTARVAPAEEPAQPESVEPNVPTGSNERAADTLRPAVESLPTPDRPERILAGTETAAVRRAVFPSPRTLTEQEVLLMRFLQQAPWEDVQTLARPLSARAIRFEELSAAPISIEPLEDITPNILSQGG